jgi:folate-binding protein YgfZ
MLFLGGDAALDPIAGALRGAGAREGGDPEFAASHILAGWPRLQAEIGERTLPQEVRFEEIGGLSYTKGCYTGQETVARLHFRGHTNRELRGLLWRGPALEGDIMAAADGGGGRGYLGTRPSTGSVGLALIRRDVPGRSRDAAGRRPGRPAAISARSRDPMNFVTGGTGWSAAMHRRAGGTRRPGRALVRPTPEPTCPAPRRGAGPRDSAAAGDLEQPHRLPGWSTRRRIDAPGGEQRSTRIPMSRRLGACRACELGIRLVPCLVHRGLW